MTQIWLVDPFMQEKSAVRAHDQNYSTQISKQGAQVDLKIFSNFETINTVSRLKLKYFLRRHKPVGPGQQIFGLITPPLLVNCVLLG